jgi:UDP-N-acetylmuramate dehydrogenase
VSLSILSDVPLAPRTTFELGGPARYLAEITDAGDALAALEWAKVKALPVFVLGGGSNLVVADEGFAGLVLHMKTRALRWSENAGEMRVEVAAGETWDDVVRAAAERGVWGIECLSGIPGMAAAAPVQNIGAYGQEVAESLRSVRVLDRATLARRELAPDECDFGYRTSVFKRQPDRFVILSVILGFPSHAKPNLRYAELAAALADASPSPLTVRDTVLALRRKKAMVWDAADPNHRSAGSFFTNPIVTAEFAAELARRCVTAGLIAEPSAMPRFDLPDGRVKLAAGWLIERAGICKGLRMGAVGVSTRHALALVHHGGGSTADLVRLARHVRTTVFDRFAVELEPEPFFLGLDWRTG